MRWMWFMLILFVVLSVVLIWFLCGGLNVLLRMVFIVGFVWEVLERFI